MSGVTEIAEARWMRVLREQCKLSSIQDVADRLGYARPTISLVLSDNYQGKTDKIAAKVIATFTDSIQCPHLGEDITQPACADFQSRAMPTSEASALRLWMACRCGCPYSYHTLEGKAGHA